MNRTTPFDKCIDLYARNLSAQEQCIWIQRTEDCFTKSYIDYLSIFFCSSQDSPAYFGLKFIFLLLWLFYLFVAIQTIAASFMCTSLLLISKKLKMSENLSSVTLYSFGVATPCIFSAISGIMNSKPQIVIAALFGSASFITQLIIGSIFALMSFRVEVLPYLRDAIFYLFLIFWIFYIFIIKKQIERFDAFGFLLFYAIYVLFAFLTPRESIIEKEHETNDRIELELSIDLRNSSSITSADENKDLDNKKQRVSKIFFSIINPIDEREWLKSNLIQKIILIIKLPILFVVTLTSPLIDDRHELKILTPAMKFSMFIQMILGPQLVLDAISYQTIPFSMVVLVISIFIALFFYYFVNSPVLFETYSSWHSFVISVFWVYIVCEETVSLLRALSIKLNLSEEFIGLTILAWGNASLDLFADIKIVLEGKPRLASSATIIAPFISLLLGVGIPCSLLFITKSDLTHLSVGLSEQMLVMFISVSVGLVLTSLHLIINRFVVWRPFGVFILIFYFLTIILEFTLEFRLWSFGIDFLSL